MFTWRYLVSGSHTWGELSGGSIVAALIIQLAALTTSLAYGRLTKPLEHV
jgi:hypothetical protein